MCAKFHEKIFQELWRGRAIMVSVKRMLSMLNGLSACAIFGSHDLSMFTLIGLKTCDRHMVYTKIATVKYNCYFHHSRICLEEKSVSLYF